jgi:hypothetical protein
MMRVGTDYNSYHATGPPSGGRCLTRAGSMEETLVALAVAGLMVWRVVYVLRLGLRRDSGPY